MKASQFSDAQKAFILRQGADGVATCSPNVPTIGSMVKAWNLDDFENGVSGVTTLTVVADDNDRTKYLDRAKAFLKQKYPVVGVIPGTLTAFSTSLPAGPRS
jgi:hypothetical protein